MTVAIVALGAAIPSKSYGQVSGWSVQDTTGDWVTTEAVPSDGYVDTEPDFHVDQNGVPWIVWVRGFGGSQEALYWSRWGGNSWSAYQRVDPNDSGIPFQPRFAFDNADTAWLVWNRVETNSRIWSIKEYEGVWWSPERVSLPDTLTYYAPSIDIGGNEIWVVWVGKAGASPYDVFVTHRVDGRWAPPTNLTQGLGGYNLFADVSVDLGGAPHVVWLDAYSGRLFYATQIGGTWTSPVALNDPNAIATSAAAGPGIVATSDGQLHVVWTGKFNNGGVLADNDIFYSRKNASGWEPATLISEDTGQLDLWPEVRIRSPGDVWITWETHDRTEADPGRILVAHFDGSSVTLPQRVDDGQFTYNEVPRIDLDATGRPWVVWGAISGDYNSDAIFFSRYVGPGTPVLLSDLRGIPLKDGVELHWQADPDAFLFFRIERSGGGAFAEAGRVALSAQAAYSWREHGLARGTYDYRIAGVPRSGDPVYLGPVVVEVGAPPSRLSLEVSGIARGGGPAMLSLGIAQGGDVRLQTLDTQGRLVSDLDLGPYPPGWHTLPWSARSAAGRNIASGVYFLRATSAHEVATGRVLVLR